MMQPGPDANMSAAVEHLLDTDPEFKSTVKKLSILAMKNLMYYMQHGTPDQKLAISRGFQPVFVKALTGEKGDKQTTDMLQQVRDIIGGVITEDVK